MKKILVVDDSESVTNLLKTKLEKTGHYQVRVENEPREAVQAAREFQPDLVLLDVMMPSMGGEEVLNWLRAEPGFRETPVYFLTALVSKKEVELKNRDIGGNLFIAKPIDIEEVLGCIQEALGPPL